jgi:hypothetical protein
LRGGAVSEVVVDGVTGRICDDPAELPAAVAEVQTYDPRACREHVVANFGAGTLGGGYEQAYRRALRQRRTAQLTREMAAIPPWPVGIVQPVEPALTGASSGLLGDTRNDGSAGDSV